MQVLRKAFAQAPAGTFRKRVAGPVLSYTRHAKRLTFDSVQTVVDFTFGYDVGHKFYWRRVRRSAGWPEVERRLLRLVDRSPSDVDGFVKTTYAVSQNPMVLIGLSRSAISSSVMRTLLGSESFESGSALQKRMRQSQMCCAGLVVSATLLLSAEKSKRFSDLAIKTSPSFSESFFQFIDASGSDLSLIESEDLRGSLLTSGFRAPKKNRLILATATTDLSALALLCNGAKRATIVGLDDLYGRADLTDFQAHAAETNISVEHPRSRITRFSANYIRVHEDTQAAAVEIMSRISAADPELLHPDDLPAAEISLADHLFFPCLQVAAIEQLLGSDEFDHVVLAIGGVPEATSGANTRFCTLLAGIDGLANDPRVEMISMAPQHASRIGFDDLLDLIVHGFRQARRDKGRQRGLQMLKQSLNAQAWRLSVALPDLPETKRDRVLFATTQVSAYNTASSAYCSTLAQEFDLQVGFLGGNLLSFTDKLEETLGPENIVTITQKPETAHLALQGWVEDVLRHSLESIKQDYVVNVISARLQEVAAGGVLSILAHLRLIDAWFQAMQASNQLPKVVVLTPFRAVRVAAFAAIARRYDVPTFAVEPFGLNASYARYSKVNADYYGVVSTYFAKAAQEGFGISSDRCPVVGSPRLSASPDHDPLAAMAAARAKIRKKNHIEFDPYAATITYFSQPSDWDQVSETWASIVEATADLNCLLILKTHPEETASRQGAYLEIAERLGATDRIVTIETDATTAIEASDLVLSGYSATVVEAALLRRPVFCVTNGETDYPLNQHDVIGGPLFRSTPALREALTDFLARPDFYQSVSTDFLKAEPQFLEGYETHLIRALMKVIALPADEAMRQSSEVPASLFLDGPHRVYQV